MAAARFLSLAAVTALLAATALATSRLGLIAHELVGHGGAALVLGAGVDAWSLSWFGGGWIRYDGGGGWSTAGSAFVACAGVAVEIALAGVALALSRRRRGAIRLALALGAGVLVAHAGFYLSAGTHHGYGDGRVLHAALPEAWRWLVVAVAGVGAVLAAAAVGRTLGRGAGAYLAGGRWQRLASLAVASLVAGGLHGALAIGEARLRAPDPTYARIMQSQSERVTAAELARLEAMAAARNRNFDRAAQRARLERETRPFPLGLVILGGMVLAGVGGAARGLGDVAGEATKLRWRDVRLVAGFAAVAIAITASL